MPTTPSAAPTTVPKISKPAEITIITINRSKTQTAQNILFQFNNTNTVNVNIKGLKKSHCSEEPNLLIYCVIMGCIIYMHTKYVWA